MTDIVMISGSFSPREGGAEKQLRNVLARFAGEGYRISVLTQMIPDFDVERREEVDGISVHRLGARGIFRRLPRLGGALFSIEAMVHAVRLNPRSILTLQLGSATIAGSIASRIRKLPHVIRLTGGGGARYKSEPFARQASVLGRFLLRIVSRPETVLVAPAKHLLRDFIACVPSFPGKTSQVMNGVTLENVATCEKKQQVVWYSRRGSEKSYETLKAVAEALPHVSFVVIGHFYESDVPQNILPLGWQERPELVLSESKVLLNTSPSEGMPNTVLQAIAHRCQVVGLSNEGMREVQDMFPNNVQLGDSSDIGVLSQHVVEALADDHVPEAIVPSQSDIFKDWAGILLREGLQSEV